jgi:hypothetical protein
MKINRIFFKSIIQLYVSVTAQRSACIFNIQNGRLFTRSFIVLRAKFPGSVFF